ncbi:dCTP deaminase [Tessaracoccus defluvii]|uniref:dCTP deaminase n=1 Tax=Tessaracoccus defluvii TaxID=1285901 RepID=UPI0031D534A4
MPVGNGVEAEALSKAKGQFLSILAMVERSARDDLLLPQLNRYLTSLVQMADEIFVRSQSRVPKPLIRSVHRELDDLGIPGLPLLVVGEPNNYSTIAGTLWSTLYAPHLNKGRAPKRPDDIYIITLPRLEGGHHLWIPVAVGHEVAHIYASLNGLFEDTLMAEEWLPTDIECGIEVGDQLPQQKLWLESTLLNWAREVYCDLYAVRRFGPAGVAAMADFLAASETSSSDILDPDYPPAWFRVETMINALPSLAEHPQYETLITIWDPWIQSQKLRTMPLGEQLMSALNANLETIQGLVESAPTASYDVLANVQSVEQVRDSLLRGFPQVEMPTGGVASPEDVLNAGWLATYSRSDSHPHPRQLDALVGRCLDNIEFLAIFGDGAARQDGNPPDDTASYGVQSAMTLGQRIEGFHPNLSADDALLVAPLSHLQINGASMDIRVGRGFITFKRTMMVGFDVRSLVQRSREMQEFVERDWGEGFTLHPGELVLAASHEYVRIPSDLTAQVVARSSYGRLGLLVATAVQVQPGYTGCVTLQLVNLGQLPITLTPGERIGQLVFTKLSTPVETAHLKYSLAVWPEFSRVSEDSDIKRLRRAPTARRK